MAIRPPQVQISTPSFDGRVQIPHFPDYSGALAAVLTQSMKQRAAEQQKMSMDEAATKVREQLSKAKVSDRAVRLIEFHPLYSPLWTGDEMETIGNLRDIGISQGLEDVEADVLARGLVTPRTVRVYPVEMMSSAYQALRSAGWDHSSASRMLDVWSGGGYMGDGDLHKSLTEEARLFFGSKLLGQQGGQTINVNTTPPVPRVQQPDGFVLTGDTGKLFSDILKQLSPTSDEGLLTTGRAKVVPSGEEIMPWKVVSTNQRGSGNEIIDTDLALLTQVVNTPLGANLSSFLHDTGAFDPSRATYGQYQREELKARAQKQKDERTEAARDRYFGELPEDPDEPSVNTPTPTKPTPAPGTEPKSQLDFKGLNYFQLLELLGDQNNQGGFGAGFYLDKVGGE